MTKRNKTRTRLTPLARRVYDLQREARSLEVKLGNLIPKLVEAELWAAAFERQNIQRMEREMKDVGEASWPAGPMKNEKAYEVFQ